MNLLQLARRSAVRCALVAVPLLAACGATVTDTTPGERGPALRVVSGGGITDTVDAALTQPVVLEVRDSSGALATNRTIELYAVPLRYTASTFLGDISEAPHRMDMTTTTDANGRVSLSVKLGTVAGNGGFEARIRSLELVDTVRFTIKPGNTTRIVLQPSDTTVGPGASYNLNASLADRYLNPTSAEPITYTDVAGLASVSATGKVTAGATTARGTIVVRSPTLEDTARVTIVPPLPMVGVRLATLGVGLEGIAVVNADGTGERRVLAQNDMYAPRMLAGNPTILSFHGEPAFNANVNFTSSVDGTNSALPGFGYSAFPSFTHDGQWVFFTGIRNGNARSVYRFPIDDPTAVDSLVSLVFDWYDAEPIVSPNGDVVAVGQCCTTKVIRVATREVSTIDRSCDRGMFSPDGTQIACVSRHDLFVMKPDGTGYRLLATNLVNGCPPDWTADGEWLIAQTLTGPTLVSAADGTRLPLTNLAGKFTQVSFVR
jgi:hypothetical protein